MVNIFATVFYLFISPIVTLYLLKMLVEGLGVDKSDFFKVDISEDLTEFLCYSVTFIKLILLRVIDEDDISISINTLMVLSAIVIDTIFLTLVTTIGYIFHISKNRKGKMTQYDHKNHEQEEVSTYQEETNRHREYSGREEGKRRSYEHLRKHEEKLRQEEKKQQEEEKQRQEEQKRQEEEKRRQEERRRRAAETEARYADILGVTPGASFAEIKKAYHQRVMEYHPDRVAGLGSEIRKVAEERTKAINEAYRYFERYFK